VSYGIYDPFDDYRFDSGINSQRLQGFGLQSRIDQLREAIRIDPGPRARPPVAPPPKPVFVGRRVFGKFPKKKKSPAQVVPRKDIPISSLEIPISSLEPGIPLERLVGNIVTPPLPTPKPPVIQETEPVSIHKNIIKTLGGALTGGIETRIKQAINPSKSPALVVAGVGAAAGRVLPAIGRVLTGRTVAAASAGAAAASFFGGGPGACPSGWHPAKDGSGRCVKNRRMNFGNARAARRSVRRLKGARKLLKDIEKMMPTRTTRRRAPAGHSSHLHHTGG